MKEGNRKDWDYHETPDERLDNKIRLAEKYGYPIVIEYGEPGEEKKTFTGIVWCVQNEEQFNMSKLGSESDDKFFNFHELSSVEQYWEHIPVHAPPSMSGVLVYDKVQWHTPPPDLTGDSDEVQRKLDMKYSPQIIGYDQGSEIFGWPPTR